METKEDCIKKRVCYSISKFQLKNNIQCGCSMRKKWDNDTTIMKTVWIFPIGYW